MSYLIEVPLTAGGRLLVEACADDVPGGIDLAARRPGDIVTRARKSIEQALEEISPAIHSVIERLTAMSPAGVTLEFGIVLGAESGAVIAKGTAEVHFNVTMSWAKPPDPAPAAGTEHSDQALETSGHG
jgi:hypothetical protein